MLDALVRCLESFRRHSRYTNVRTRNGNIYAEGGSIADLAIRAVTNRSLLRVRVAFDPDVAAVARAVDFHGFAPFTKSALPIFGGGSQPPTLTLMRRWTKTTMRSNMSPVWERSGECPACRSASIYSRAISPPAFR